MQEGAQGESHVASTDDELAKVPAVRKRVGLVRLAELLKGLDAMLGSTNFVQGFFYTSTTTLVEKSWLM